MNSEETVEFNAVTDIFEIVKNTIATFENKIIKLSHNHLDFLISLACYIYYDVDDTEKVLKAEFDKCMKNYKRFCYKYSKFLMFKEACLPLSSIDKTDLKEFMGFVFNYKENFEILDRHKINKFVKKLANFGKNDVVSFDIAIKYEEDYEKFINDIVEISEKLKNEYKDSSGIKGLKLKVKKVVDLFNSYQIMEHCDNLAVFGNTLMNKYSKLAKAYLHKCVLKQQSNFVYERTANQTTDCAICLEEFKNGTNVTKLKCGHLFCSECIEKWLSNSMTCPCCRQNPRF